MRDKFIVFFVVLSLILTPCCLVKKQSSPANSDSAGELSPTPWHDNIEDWQHRWFFDYDYSTTTNPCSPVDKK